MVIFPLFLKLFEKWSILELGTPDFFLIICIGQVRETYSSIGHSKKSCIFGPNWCFKLFICQKGQKSPLI